MKLNTEMRPFNKVWIPSADRELFFSEITHQQEKNLAKAAKQTSPNMVSFCKSLNDVMLENDVERFYNYTIIDRIYYAIYTRGMCFDNDLKYSLECPVCNESFQFSISINDVIKSLEYKNDTFDGMSNNIEYTIGWPDIHVDLDYRRNVENNKQMSYMDTAVLYLKNLRTNDLFIPYSEFTPNERFTMLMNSDKMLVGDIYHSVENFISNRITNKIYECACINCNEILYTLDTSISSLFGFVISLYNTNLQDIYIKEMNYLTLYPGTDINQLIPIERDVLINLKIDTMNQQKEKQQFEDKYGGKY